MAAQIFTPKFSILLILILAISSYSTYAIYSSDKIIDYRDYDKSIDAGLELTINGKHQEAFMVYLPLAKKGIPRAKLYLAVSYYHGRGVDRDIDAAKKLFFELQHENYEPHIISTYLNLINSMPQT